MTGDPRFHQLLKEIGELHDKKQEDYGSDSDPFANVRSSEDWGIELWVGALVRLNDKVHRLQQFARKGELANESAEDSMFDIAVYALIALILYREETPGKTAFDLDFEGDMQDPEFRQAYEVARNRIAREEMVGTPTDEAEHEPAKEVRLVYCNCTSGPCHERA